MSTFKKICIGLLATIIIIPIAVLGYIYFKLNSMYDKEEANTIKNEQSEKTKEKEKDGVTNILLVGTDGEHIDKYNRSDGTMVVTIDSINNEIRLSSIARDTLVNIPGDGYE